MYLSHLLIDVGTKPDRPRPGRLWLRNVQRVHQRLCMAFPSAERKSRDPQFLRPYHPEGFDRQVHVPRGQDAGFLFRVDPFPLGRALPHREPERAAAVAHGRAVILVQSAVEPDWDYAFHNALHLLAAPPEARAVECAWAAGDVCHFRLRANPTRKRRVGTEMAKIEHGVRVGLYTEDEQLAWLARKGEEGGFRLVSCHVVPEGKVYGTKMEPKTPDGGREECREHKMQHFAVRFDGVLQVTDPEALLETVRCGIGPAKAFGFGLLSLARV